MSSLLYTAEYETHRVRLTPRRHANSFHDQVLSTYATKTHQLIKL